MTPTSFRGSLSNLKLTGKSRGPEALQSHLNDSYFTSELRIPDSYDAKIAKIRNF